MSDSGEGAERHARIASHLQALWREQLRLDNVPTDQSYFDLGGNSMMLVQMLVQASSGLGAQIDYEAFLEAPTLESLIALYAAAAAPPDANATT